MLTRKHFQSLANIIRGQRFINTMDRVAIDKSTVEFVLQSIESELIIMCREENPNFDVNKFKEACNVTKD